MTVLDTNSAASAALFSAADAASGVLLKLVMDERVSRRDIRDGLKRLGVFVSSSTIDRWINGTHEPSMAQFFALLRVVPRDVADQLLAIEAAAVGRAVEFTDAPTFEEMDVNKDGRHDTNDLAEGVAGEMGDDAQAATRVAVAAACDRVVSAAELDALHARMIRVSRWVRIANALADKLHFARRPRMA